MTTTMSAALAQSVPGGFALGDFWSLTQQAGPLRWPIFFVLALGLIQVFVKLYELMRDKRVSKALLGVDFSNVSLSEILRLVAKQQESMLASLQSTMLNVFQTRPGEGLLHDEITNFVQFQRDQFEVFRRRLEFLSDTAGALGLMGTVWGMFTVFFQGTAQQDVILRGMGIALITTLLGLVVSIILNFASTELSTVFNKRLEVVSTKSDELRFRLMELAPKTLAPASQPVPAAASAQPPTAATTSPAPTAPAAQPVAEKAKWRYVELDGGPREARAGETLKGLRVVVKNGDGRPAPGVPVVVTVASPFGALEGGGRQVRTSSDEAGYVELVCTAPEAVGPFALDVALPEQPGPPTRVDLAVQPGPPQKIEVEGNNQAAIAGMRLPAPLGVRVHDRFGNAIAGVPVEFAVKQGDGKLGANKAEVRVPTDASGRAATPFAVSSEAGQNVVTATVAGTKQPIQFVAFGTEV